MEPSRDMPTTPSKRHSIVYAALFWWPTLSHIERSDLWRSLRRHERIFVRKRLCCSHNVNEVRSGGFGD